MLIEPLPTRGLPSTLNLLSAYKNAVMHLIGLEWVLNGQAELKPSDSHLKLFDALIKAIYQIPFHPQHYAPKEVLDLDKSTAIAATIQNFERARELRFKFIENNLLEIHNDSHQNSDNIEIEKLYLIKEYLEKHIDHLRSQ